MKITFIYPDVLLHRHDWTGYFYVGVALLSTVLKKEGHKTSLFHVTKPVSRSNFMKSVEKEDPDLIAFSSTSPMFPFVREFASWLNEARARVRTICGGIHPTIAPDDVIGTDGIDIICRGEGEAPLSELCQKIESNEDISDIQNLWVKKEDDIIKNPIRPLLEDLDSLPFPDRSIFNYETLYGENEGRGTFMVSRGCPYNCSYCCNHLIRQIYGSNGKAVRFRSVDNVIEEITEVIETYPFIKSLNFDDDILFLKRKWSEEFAEKYSNKIHLPFTCNARANITGKTRVDLMKKAGCHHIKFGLESGNEYISNKVLNRNLTNESIKKAFALCREAGLTTESFNMVGIPCDTPKTILDTIKLNAEIGVDRMQVSIYQPFHGTRLADICRKQNFLQSTDLNPDFFSVSLRLDTISASQVLMFRDYFKVLVHYYQVIQNLPAGFSRFFIRLSDSILSSGPTSKALNSIYIPLNYLYRRSLTLRLKLRIALRRPADSKLRIQRSTGKKIMKEPGFSHTEKVAASLPTFAWIALTNRCNLDCTHCQRSLLREQGLLKNREMSWKVFNRLEEEVFPSLKRIQFGGNNFGEQLLASKWDDIFEKVRKRNIRMVIVTNGTLLNRERARAMVEAGVEFNFSLEGARKESYEAVRGQSFDKFIGVIRDTCQEKINRTDTGAAVNLGFTVFYDNIREITELLRMAASLGVDKAVVTHFIPWQESQRRQSLVYHKVLCNEMLEKARILAGELDMTVYLPRPFVIDSNNGGQIFPQSDNRKPCYHPWRSFSVNEKGDVMPCCATSVVMGNLGRSSFSEIWHGKKYQRLRKTVNSSRPLVFCRDCAFREIDVERDEQISFWSDEDFLLAAIGTDTHRNTSFTALRTIKNRLMKTRLGGKVMSSLMQFYRGHAAFYVTDFFDSRMASFMRRLSKKG